MPKRTIKETFALRNKPLPPHKGPLSTLATLLSAQGGRCEEIPLIKFIRLINVHLY